MDYNNLNWNYINLMQQAEAATSRQEALKCIHMATQLKQAMAAKKAEPPADRYSRWCGGPGGWNDYAERMH